MKNRVTAPYGAMLLAAGWMFATPGIVQADGDPTGLTENVPMAETMMFTGRVERLELEGGFWGIITDEGRKLDPGKLPDAVQVHGLRVQGRAKLLNDVMTVRMWGTPVAVLEINAAP